MNAPPNFDELRRSPHWSFSALNSVLNICSLQYSLGRIEKVTPAFTPVNLVFGKAFHRSASYLYNMLQEDSLLNTKELDEFFEQSFKSEIDSAQAEVLFAEDKGLSWMVEKGQQMLGVLHDNLDPDDRVLETDYSFSVDLVDAHGNIVSKPLIGEFDAVVENKGRLIVVDFKTAASKWPVSKCHTDLQATAYLYALRQPEPKRESLFRYDVITKAKTPVLTRHLTNRTEDDFQRFIQLVKMADRIVENELFYPHETSFACHGCQYQEACAQWQENQLKGSDLRTCNFCENSFDPSNGQPYKYEPESWLCHDCQDPCVNH